MVNVAHAKAAKCAAVQVPGKPGTFVVNCSTQRPWCAPLPGGADPGV